MKYLAALIVGISLVGCGSSQSASSNPSSQSLIPSTSLAASLEQVQQIWNSDSSLEIIKMDLTGMELNHPETVNFRLYGADSDCQETFLLSQDSNGQFEVNITYDESAGNASGGQCIDLVGNYSVSFSADNSWMTWLSDSKSFKFNLVSND